MRLLSTSVWDENFFEQFVQFRNDIHKNIVTSFPEKTEDYKKYFGPDSPFEEDYFWEAFLVYDDGKIIAKCILSWRKDSKTGNLGFIDWENQPDAARLIQESVSATAKRHGLNRLKTPVDLNLFIKYRIRLPGGGEPYWGEPIYPDYYHDLFEITGFKEIARWDTYRMNKLQNVIDYFLKRVKLSRKPTGSHGKTKNKNLRTSLRCVRMNDWDNELKVIHKLFNEAYQSMPEWEPITFEQFRLVYDDFKYIINPWYSYIVELRGVPVGFSINFADPLPILEKVKGKELSSVEKALLFLKLRMNNSSFLIAHVGKIPGPDGEEIKGVQIQVSRRLQLFGMMMKKILVTFQVKNSPSRRSFEEKHLIPYAQYALYGKDL